MKKMMTMSEFEIIISIVNLHWSFDFVTNINNSVEVLNMIEVN